MTENEAIKNIKDILDECTESEEAVCYVTDVDAPALEMAINALEKQIPKKPENKKYSFYPHSTLLKSKYGECPTCKTIQVDDEYCANCGQKLDWSNEE